MAVEVEVIWQGAMAFVGTGAASNFPVKMDASPDVGGSGQGARPMELLLIALGGCTGMDVVSILKKMRQELTDYQIKIRGERAPEHPRAYTHITVEHIIRGRNLNPELVEKAVRLSETKYCSVLATINKAARVEVLTTIIDEARVA
jgi:putative redox protein